MKNPFSVGDRVILISNRYGDRSNNPVWLGNHGCVKGTITHLGAAINVAWDNDRRNTYVPDTLNFAPDYQPGTGHVNPNTAFARKKRYSRGK